MIKKSINFILIDRPVFSVILLRAWQISSGGFLVILIPNCLTSIEQGYYFTFSSLVALQVFFELGMSQVLIQMVGSECAHVKIDKNYIASGKNENIQRLRSLIKITEKWYLIASVIFLIFTIIFGVLFFYSKGDLELSSWIYQWIILVLFSSINLYLVGSLTIIEGCNLVSKVAYLRLRQSIAGTVLMAVVLIYGGGLWAPILMPFTACVVTLSWMYKNKWPIKKILNGQYIYDADLSYSWRKDIFPFHWRIAISWISGYFIFQLFSPIAFSRFGAIEAGKLGLTMAIFSALLTISMSWINAKLPKFSALVAKNNRILLNELFIKSLRNSVIFLVLGVSAIFVVYRFLMEYNFNYVDRFSSIPVILAIAIATIANCIIFSLAAYMRAHRKEPMLWPSIIGGIFSVIAIYYGSLHGLLFMMQMYNLVTVFLILPWTIYLFLKYYNNKYHKYDTY